MPVRQLIYSGGYIATPLNAHTRYWFLMGGYTSGVAVNEIDRVQPFPCAGTLKNFKGYNPDAPGAGDTITLTVRKNLAPTLMSVSWTGAAPGGTGIRNDLVNEVAVAVGDLICVQDVGTGTPNPTSPSWSVEFEPSGPADSVQFGSSDGVGMTFGAPPANQYLGISGGYNMSSNATVRMPIIAGGTIRDLVAVLNIAPGVGESFTFAVCINGVDSGVTCTISGLNTTGSDLVNTVAVASGDWVSVHVTSSGGAANAQGAIGINYQSTPPGYANILNGTNDSPSNAAQEFNRVQMNDFGVTWNAVAEQVLRGQITHAVTIKGFVVKITTAPGAGRSWVFTLRVNQVNTGLAVTIANAEIEGSSSGEVSVSEDDFLSIGSEPTGAPGVTGIMKWATGEYKSLSQPGQLSGNIASKLIGAGLI